MSTKIIKILDAYRPDSRYSTRVAYFSMEFAIDQSLKIYSGGLGFLAGSHMRSAYALKQNMIGIGILWKNGYYDQTRYSDGSLKPAFVAKEYSFLEDTEITFTIRIHDVPVHVRAYMLKPDTFQTAPIFLLSTDIEENDYVSRTISHNLYDSIESTRIAQSMLLGIGGAKLLDLLGLHINIYHMNEGHALPLTFYLYNKYGSVEEVKRRVVFTTHTPEMAGNEVHSVFTLNNMTFFDELSKEDGVKLLRSDGETINYTLSALRMSKRSNAVSDIHRKVAQEMWGSHGDISEIIGITNAQNKKYWTDPVMKEALESDNDDLLIKRKKELKKTLFKIVADQCGKLFDPDVLTIVWARRFAGYKRAWLIMEDFEMFRELVTRNKTPIQIIWAGKPYPKSQPDLDLFNHIYNKTKSLARCAVLWGYEMELSAQLKKGSDIWLNTPRFAHEASGTSGMTAAMNGSINLSIPDGWIPEFAKDGENSFLIKLADLTLSQEERDRQEALNLMSKLKDDVIPMYYNDQKRWIRIQRQAARDIDPFFDSDRMAIDYYTKMYNYGK